MLCRLVACCLAVLLWLASAPSGLAQKRVALVFGADAYQTIRPLDNAVEDAAAMADLLRGLGFSVTLELDRDLPRMRRALSEFEAEHSGADVALIYYAGHGVEIGGTNLLLPVDIPATSLDALTAGALPLNELREVAVRMAPAALIIIDACRDDPFGTTSEAAARSGARLVEAEKAQVRLGMGRMGEAKNTLFVFAAAPGMVALDGSEGHSPFTTALTRYFGTPGVEIRSALTLVQQEVYDRTSGRQLPYLESALPSLLYIAAETGPELAERDRLLMAMAGLDAAVRQEVEEMAAQRDMPLAPLYGAILAAGLDKTDSATRRARLAEAADSYLAIAELMRTFSASDPEVKALHAAAQERLSVGALGEAMALAEQARDIDLAALGGIDRVRIERTLSAAESAKLVAGIALTRLDYPAAIAAYEQAETLYASIATLSLDEAARDDLAWAPFDLAQVLERAGAIDDAIAAYLRMEAATDQWLGLSPANPKALRARAVAFGSRGALLSRRGETGTVHDLFEQSSAILFALLADDPDNPKLLRDLMVAEVRLGDLLNDIFDFDGAERRYRSALDQADFALARDPEDVVALSDAILTRTRLGDFFLQSRRDADSAEAFYRDSLAILEKLTALAPERAETRRDLMLGHCKLGEVALLRGDAAALDWTAKAETLARALLERDPAYVLHREDLAYVLALRVDALLLVQNPALAIAPLQEATALAADLVAEDPADTARLRRLLTLHLRHIKLGMDLPVHLREAIGLMRRLESLEGGDPADRRAMEELLAQIDPSYRPDAAPQPETPAPDVAPARPETAVSPEADAPEAGPEKAPREVARRRRPR